LEAPWTMQTASDSLGAFPGDRSRSHQPSVCEPPFGFSSDLKGVRTDVDGGGPPPIAAPCPAVARSSSRRPPTAPITPLAAAGRKIVVPFPCVIAGSASRYLRPRRYMAACPSGSAAV